jgi:hypothetical protein
MSGADRRPLDQLVMRLHAAKGKSMKLWLLLPAKPLPVNDNPWEPWFDKAFGFVVRAITEEDARTVAHNEAGNENRGEFLRTKTANTKAPWLDARYSTCVELLPDGEPGLVMKDFAAA